MASVLSRAVPPLPDSVFRQRLETIHGCLLELEGIAPSGHVAALAGVLEFLEDELVTLGWEPPPLSENDKDVLAAAGAL